MTLQAHRFIDGLRGNPGTKFYDDGLTPFITPKVRAELADSIEIAAKFDFQQIPLEPNDLAQGKYTIPLLSNAEREFWIQGLIPLPMGICWYEFILSKTRTGLLVREQDSKWYVNRLDIVDDHVVYDGTVTCVSSEDMNIKLGITAPDNPFMVKMVERNKESMAGMGAFAIYLTLMLSSRSTETEIITAPQALNKKRARSGKAPLQGYRVVTIAPRKYLHTDQGGTHASPRLHWRRSHLRHYDHRTPGAKYMPTSVHKGQAGWWVTVIPRQLVGKAELGEVTHDYRVL